MVRIKPKPRLKPQHMASSERIRYDALNHVMALVVSLLRNKTIASQLQSRSQESIMICSQQINSHPGALYALEPVCRVHIGE